MNKFFASGCDHRLHTGHIQCLKAAKLDIKRDAFVKSANCNRAIEPYITIR